MGINYNDRGMFNVCFCTNQCKRCGACCQYCKCTSHNKGTIITNYTTVIASLQKPDIKNVENEEIEAILKRLIAEALAQKPGSEKDEEEAIEEVTGNSV